MEEISMERKTLDLSRTFYNAVVRPALMREYPRLKYSAGFIGRSTLIEKDPLPQVQLFFNDSDLATAEVMIRGFLEKELSQLHIGLFSYHTIHAFYHEKLNYNPFKKISTRDWLSFSQQSLADLAQGEVFDDGLKKLEFIREKFAYYPKEVWSYLYLQEWKQIVEDDLNNRTLLLESNIFTFELYVNHIVMQIIRLTFFLEKRYIPSIKYLGDSCTDLPLMHQLKPFIKVANRKDNRAQTVDALVTMYNIIMRKQSVIQDISNQEIAPAKAMVEVLSENVDASFYRRLTYKN